MIKKIVIGDIIDPKNRNDIIIGMNTDLEDVTGIGLRFVQDIIPSVEMELGAVITFNFDQVRKLHMIICHKLGPNGWVNADQHVRFGMDYLNHHNTNNRSHSIVQIGTGRIGKRDRADAPAILTAMAQSHLGVDLYVFDGVPMMDLVQERVPLKALSAWSPVRGELLLAA